MFILRAITNAYFVSSKDSFDNFLIDLCEFYCIVDLAMGKHLVVLAITIEIP